MVQLHFSCPGKDSTLGYAQDQLAAYLTRMLPDADTVIQAGLEVAAPMPLPRAQWDPFLDDWYCIHADPGSIRIQGSNSRAVLLGVYRLLHVLGCRFLMPGTTQEIVPVISPEDLCADLTESAACRHRGVCIEGADSVENVLDFIDWLPKVGCNSFFVQHLEPEAFLKNWYDHKYNPLLSPEALTGEDYERMYRAIDEAIALRGLLHHRVGHGWTCKAIGFEHVCAHLPAPTDEQRPLLAEVNGRREFWQGVPSNTNLCYSNATAADAFVRSVVEYAARHPEVDFLHVWLADEYNNICECDACRKTTLSDQYVELLNRIDAELTERGLRTRIVFLLYQELLWPPTTARLNHPERFTLMFAPISRTFEKSYADRGPIPAMPPFRRNHITLPATVEENIASLEAWQKQCGVDAFVYDYPLGRAHYGDLGYCAIAKIISRDIPELPALKLDGYISCQELRAALPNALPGYVMGRMLWDNTLTYDALQEEYFSALYGSHWQEARDCLEQLSALSSADYFNGIGPRVDARLAQRLHQAAEAAAVLHETAARRAAETCGLTQNAWQLLDYHAGYCRLISGALAAQADGRQAEAQQQWLTVMQYIREHETQYQPYLDVYRVLEVATKYTGFVLDVPR